MSFHRPDCGHEETILFDTKTQFDQLIEHSMNYKCSACGQVTELDEDERAFFSFLSYSA